MPYLYCVTSPRRPPEGIAAVIYNPLKVSLPKLKKSVNAAAKEAGFAPTIWFATTEEDAGQRLTASALRRGATVVIAAGGDGTVRAVAEGLRRSGVPLGLIPSGTGNLLARNLGMDVRNTDEQIAACFGEKHRTIDLGVARIQRETGPTEEHAFVVMAGLGLDAKMIANTSPGLKKAVGWLAYVDGITRSIPELKPIRLRYALDNGAERTTNVHTIIIGNCGMLPGGILLMPDALPDDGTLDIAALRPRGPFGWLRVWNKIAWENGVLRKSAAGRKIIDLSRDVKDVMYLRGTQLRLRVDSPQEFQLDGDEFGEAVSVETWVDPGALLVKVAE
jgi:diacylglycerol kinase (ATP)